MKTKLLRRLRRKAKKDVRLKWHRHYYGIAIKNEPCEILGCIRRLQIDLNAIEHKLIEYRREYILDLLNKMYINELKKEIKDM